MKIKAIQFNHAVLIPGSEANNAITMEFKTKHMQTLVEVNDKGITLTDRRNGNSGFVPMSNVLCIVWDNDKSE